MLVQRRPILNTTAYTLLVLGSVLFSFPFVWMVCSSIKVDRELFPERLEILPRRPNASPQSPFVDTDYYRYAVSRRTERYVPVFQELVRAVGYPFPDSVDRFVALEQVTRGFARKVEAELPPVIWEATRETVLTLLNRYRDVPDASAGLFFASTSAGKLWLDLARELEQNLPAAAWSGPAESFSEHVVTYLAGKWARTDVIDDLFRSVYRWLGIGQVRVRSYGLVEQELGAGQPVSRRFQNLTPTTLWLEDTNDRGTACAVAHTDFRVGTYWRLEQTFDLNFDVADLHRIQLYIRPDDNWHQLHCYVEKQGALYKSTLAVYPANYEWAIFTWQEPGPDDETNKIKTWTHLKKVDEDPSRYVSEPRKIKIAFELRRCSLIGAWIGKITRNYVLTLQHIPVWRYTATSFYLVVLNIVLSVFACSMVAFAVARLQWPGRDFCFLLMLATMMVPSQVTMIPGFLIWKSLGFYNTLVPLWLPAVFGSPFFIFLLRQFLKSIPRDLEDAARIDGCSYWQIYWHIMLPLVKPTLAVIAIGTFMGTWNNFMGPLIFIADQRLYPLAFGLYAFGVQVGNNAALTMAGSFLMTVPIIVVFFFAQRYFIEGVTLTGLKG